MRGVLNTYVRLLAVLSWTLLGTAVVYADRGAETLSEAPTQSVNLDSLIRQALEKSPGLQAKKRSYEAARGRVLSAWFPDDPEIGVDVEGQPDLFQFSKRTDNEYMVMQRIPFPTKLFLRAQVASREAQIAYQRYKEEERNIVWHIEQPYYEFSMTQKILAALEEILALLDKLAHAVQARYETNKASQQDLLKAQIERSKVEIEIFNAKQQEHLSEAHFSHLLNQSLETRYTIAEEKPRPSLLLSRPELERLALAMRPELRALDLGIKRAKASRLLSITNWLPDLTGRMEARQFKGEGGIRENDTFLGVTVPVWSLIKGFGGEWKSANQDVKEAEALYDEMKNEVLLAVHEADAKVKSAEHALEVYEQSVLPQAKQQVGVALAAYEAGRSDFLNLMDAQRMLKDAQIAYSRFQADYERGFSDLHLALGGEFKPAGQLKGGNL